MPRRLGVSDRVVVLLNPEMPRLGVRFRHGAIERAFGPQMHFRTGASGAE